MVQLSIGELAEIVGGTLHFDSMPPLGGDLEPLRRVQVDSGRVAPGDVFWGLVHDGQNTAWRAEEAYSRGALGAVVCSRNLTPWAGRFSLEVADAELALWRLARWTRRQFSGTVVAVLGGNSRITAQMIAAALGGERCALLDCTAAAPPVAAPLGLLDLDSRHEAAVFEFGDISRHRDVRKAARLCRPDIVVMLDAGDASPQSSRAPQQAYTEFFAEMPRGGAVIIDGDDLVLRRLVHGHRGRKILVGRGIHCDVVATDVQFQNTRLAFSIERASYSVRVCGRHYLANALSACAAARAANVSEEESAAGLSQFQPPPGQRSFCAEQDVTVIDETAAETSTVFRSLDACGEFAARGRRIVVCGALRNDNDGDPKELHHQFARAVVDRCGADWLIVCGPGGEQIAQAAASAGMPADRTIQFECAQLAARRLEDLLAPGDVVLATPSPLIDMKQIVVSLTSEKMAAAA